MNHKVKTWQVGEETVIRRMIEMENWRKLIALNRRCFFPNRKWQLIALSFQTYDNDMHGL